MEPVGPFDWEMCKYYRNYQSCEVVIETWTVFAMKVDVGKLVHCLLAFASLSTMALLDGLGWRRFLKIFQYSIRSSVLGREDPALMSKKIISILYSYRND